MDTTFRGLSAPRVEQELWATLALYNLVRRLMADAAEVHHLDPRQISFVDSLEVVRMALPAVQGCASACYNSRPFNDFRPHRITTGLGARA